MAEADGKSGGSHQVWKVLEEKCVLGSVLLCWGKSPWGRILKYEQIKVSATSREMQWAQSSGPKQSLDMDGRYKVGEVWEWD